MLSVLVRQQKSATATAIYHTFNVLAGGTQIYPEVGGQLIYTSASGSYVVQQAFLPVIVTADSTAITVIGYWSVNEAAGTDTANSMTIARIA